MGLKCQVHIADISRQKNRIACFVDMADRQIMIAGELFNFLWIVAVSSAPNVFSNAARDIY